MDILDLASLSMDAEWLKKLRELKEEKIDYDKNYIKNTKFETVKNKKGEYYIVSKENEKNIEKPNMSELDRAMNNFMANILNISGLPENKFKLGEKVMTIYNYEGTIEDIGINKKYLVEYYNEYDEIFETTWFLEDELDLIDDFDEYDIDEIDKPLKVQDLKNKLKDAGVTDNDDIYLNIDDEYYPLKDIEYHLSDKPTDNGILVFNTSVVTDEEEIKINEIKNISLYLNETLLHDESLKGIKYNEIGSNIIVATDRIKKDILIYLSKMNIYNSNFKITEHKDENGRYVIFVDEKTDDNKQIERYVFTNFRFNDTWREE